MRSSFYEKALLVSGRGGGVAPLSHRALPGGAITQSVAAVPRSANCSWWRDPARERFSPTYRANQQPHTLHVTSRRKRKWVSLTPHSHALPAPPPESVHGSGLLDTARSSYAPRHASTHTVSPGFCMRPTPTRCAAAAARPVCSGLTEERTDRGED